LSPFVLEVPSLSVVDGQKGFICITAFDRKPDELGVIVEIEYHRLLTVLDLHVRVSEPCAKNITAISGTRYKLVVSVIHFIDGTVLVLQVTNTAILVSPGPILALRPRQALLLTFIRSRCVRDDRNRRSQGALRHDPAGAQSASISVVDRQGFSAVASVVSSLPFPFAGSELTTVFVLDEAVVQAFLLSFNGVPILGTEHLLLGGVVPIRFKAPPLLRLASGIATRSTVIKTLVIAREGQVFVTS